MEGFFGDVLKTVIAVMLAIALLVILIFFYHLQSLSHYQHAVNSILQRNSQSIDYNSKGQFSGNRDSNSTVSKLYSLDDKYGWIFTIQPNDDSTQSRYNYGDHETYTVQAHIPMLLNRFSNKDYSNNGKNFDKSGSHFVFDTHINGQTTCELDKDADINHQ